MSDRPSKLAEDAKASEATEGLALEEAFRKVKISLVHAFLPVIEEQGPKIAEAIGAIADDLKGVDLVGAFKGIIQGIAGMTYGLIDILPEDLKKSFGSKTQSTLAKLAGIDENAGGATKSGIFETALDKEAHAENYVDGVPGVIAGITCMGIDARQQQKLGPAGVKNPLDEYNAIPGSEGGNPAVQGPPRPPEKPIDGAKIGNDIADAFSKNLSLLRLDPARYMPAGGDGLMIEIVIQEVIADHYLVFVGLPGDIVLALVNTPAASLRAMGSATRSGAGLVVAYGRA